VIEVEDMLTTRPLMPHEQLHMTLERLVLWRQYVKEALEETPTLKCDTQRRRYPKRKRSAPEPSTIHRRAI
jgi:hypothetical protein